MALDLSVHFHTGASSCPPNICTRKCDKRLFPSEQRPVLFAVEDPEPGAIPAPTPASLLPQLRQRPTSSLQPKLPLFSGALLTSLTPDPCLRLFPCGRDPTLHPE